MAERMGRYVASLASAGGRLVHSAGEVMRGDMSNVVADNSGVNDPDDYQATAPPLPEDNLPLLPPILVTDPSVSATTSSAGRHHLTPTNNDQIVIKTEPVERNDISNSEACVNNDISNCVRTDISNNEAVVIKSETVVRDDISNSARSPINQNNEDSNVGFMNRSAAPDLNLDINSVSSDAIPDSSGINISSISTSINSVTNNNITSQNNDSIHDNSVPRNTNSVTNDTNNISSVLNNTTHNNSDININSGAQAIAQSETRHTSIYPSLDYGAMGARPKVYNNNSSFHGFDGVQPVPPADLRRALDSVNTGDGDRPPSYTEACRSPIPGPSNRSVFGDVTNQTVPFFPPPEGFDPTNIKMLVNLQKGTGMFASYTPVSMLL